MSKTRELTDCRTYDDFRRAASDKGLNHKRTCGGHEVWGNQRGSFPLPTHGEPSPALRHKIVKEILALIAVLVVLATWIAAL